MLDLSSRSNVVPTLIDIFDLLLRGIHSLGHKANEGMLSEPIKADLCHLNSPARFAFGAKYKRNGKTRD